MKARPATHSSVLSLAAILLTLAFAMIVHFDESGAGIVYFGIAMMALFSALWALIIRAGSGIAITAYGLLSLVPVFGFGIVNGFWNHLVKLLLFSLHGNQLPPPMAGLFFSQNFGSHLVEAAGILMFASAMVAAAATSRFLRGEWAVRKDARADRRGTATDTKAPWAKGERFTRTAGFRVEAPAAKVFPLLCPVREYEWIPDWACVMIYSESGVAEKDAVFTTLERPLGKMLWTCVDYNPPSRIDYLLTFGAKVSIRLELELTEKGGGCDLSWTMRFTVASPLMAALLRRRMSEKAFAKMVGDRESQLADYFSRRR